VTLDLRPTFVAVYVTVSMWAAWRWGLPTDRFVLIPWAIGGALLWNARRAALLLPVAAALLGLLVAYDLTRGAADSLGMPVQVQLPIHIDRALFGEVPTVWLQRRLLRDGTQWWETLVGLTYVSHFVVPYAVGVALWMLARDRGVRWLKVFLVVTAAGLATYVLLPTAPPWLAARGDRLDPVARVAVRGLRPIGLHGVGELVDLGRRAVNQVAALPSLHAAYTVVTACSLWPGRRARPLLVAYPLMMGFTLVWSGEHYVVDVVLGWLYAAAAVAGVHWWEQRRDVTA
jgi:hypothetical protein